MGDTTEGGGGAGGKTQTSGTGTGGGGGESAGGYDYRKLHNFPLIKVHTYHKLKYNGDNFTAAVCIFISFDSIIH